MSVKRTVLVVEDERDLADLLRYNLEQTGYRCRCVGDGEAALAEVRRDAPDLLILDRMLPGLPGDEVIAKLRHEPTTAGIPVIMLTAKAEEADEFVGFALGADDYVAKPFSMKLLLARVGAILRRASTPTTASGVLSVGSIALDRDRREARVDDEPVDLTSTEFGILWELIAARGRVLERQQLIDRVLGASVVVTDRTIDVHVAALRRKLGSAATLIQTIRGVGYVVRPRDGEQA